MEIELVCPRARKTHQQGDGIGAAALKRPKPRGDVDRDPDLDKRPTLGNVDEGTDPWRLRRPFFPPYDNLVDTLSRQAVPASDRTEGDPFRVEPIHLQAPFDVRCLPNGSVHEQAYCQAQEALVKALYCLRHALFMH